MIIPQSPYIALVSGIRENCGECEYCGGRLTRNAQGYIIHATIHREAPPHDPEHSAAQDAEELRALLSELQ